jgi:hypothetical protein
MELIDQLLPIVANILTGWLAAILVWRKLHTRYPFFFVYVLFSIVSTFALILVRIDLRAYFTMFWAIQAIDVILSLFSLHEVFRHVFRPFYRVLSWFWLLFPAIGLLIALISVYQVILRPPAQAPAIGAVVLSFSMAANYVRLGLFGLFFVLVLLLGSGWRSYPFGIMKGFAAVAMGEVFSFGLRYEFGTKYNMLARYGPPAAFLCGIVLWLITFLQPPESESGPFWSVTPEELFGPAKAYPLNRILFKANNS